MCSVDEQTYKGCKRKKHHSTQPAEWTLFSRYGLTKRNSYFILRLTSWPQPQRSKAPTLPKSKLSHHGARVPWSFESLGATLGLIGPSVVTSRAMAICCLPPFHAVTSSVDFRVAFSTSREERKIGHGMVDEPSPYITQSDHWSLLSLIRCGWIFYR